MPPAPPPSTAAPAFRTATRTSPIATGHQTERTTASASHPGHADSCESRTHETASSQNTRPPTHAPNPTAAALRSLRTSIQERHQRHPGEPPGPRRLERQVQADPRRRPQPDRVRPGLSDRLDGRRRLRRARNGGPRHRSASGSPVAPLDPRSRSAPTDRTSGRSLDADRAPKARLIRPETPLFGDTSFRPGRSGPFRPRAGMTGPPSPSPTPASRRRAAPRHRAGFPRRPGEPRPSAGRHGRKTAGKPRKTRPARRLLDASDRRLAIDRRPSAPPSPRSPERVASTSDRGRRATADRPRNRNRWTPRPRAFANADELATAIFGLTYLGLAIGRVPGLRIDRAGIALVGAAAMLAAGVLGLDEAAAGRRLRDDRPALRDDGRRRLPPARRLLRAGHRPDRRRRSAGRTRCWP